MFDITAEYFLLGAVYDCPTSERFHAFGSISMGAGLFSPADPTYADNWRFTVAFGGGGFWCGTGGCNVGVGGSTTFIQGEVSGGLFLAF